MDGQQQKSIHVLLIEDEAGDAGLIRFALRQAQHVSFQVTWMSCLRELHEWEQNTSHGDEMFDIVLLDLNLPDSFGLQTIQTVQTVLEAVPVVVLTGHHDTEFALQTLEAGVQDYLLKENIAADQLERAIRYALSRHELEQALAVSRERMQLALDGAGLGTWDWTIASDQLLINSRWRTMLGYQDDSTIANIETTAAWRALIHPEDRPRVEAALMDHLEGRSPIYEQEYRMCHVAGHWVWIFSSGRILQRDKHGQPLRAAGIHLDITQRKLAEMRLHLLHTALEAADNAIVITDTDAVIEWVNPAFEKLTGYSVGEAMGRKPKELVKSGHQDEGFYRAMWDAILNGQSWRGELLNRRKSGDLYHEEMTITPVSDNHGKITHFIGIKQDITQRKALEDELRTLASTDTLTGLPNRRAFMSRLEMEWQRCRCFPNNSVAVLMLDLDRFKRINDTYGHAGGDEVLKHFASLLMHELRLSDMAGRLGGEEFAVLLTGITPDGAKAYAERLRNTIASPPTPSQPPIAYSSSIGITLIHPCDVSADQALLRADDALYQAKANGRNRVEALFVA